MEKLIYPTEERGDKPLYIFLYEHIRDDIISGRLQSGEKLPSKRMLAGEYGIAIITVENTYAQLEFEGYIYSKPRKGYYVAENLQLPEHTVTVKSVMSTESVTEIKNEVKGTRKVNGENSGVGYFMDFSVNSGGTDTFPFDAWIRLSRKVMLDNEGAFLKSPPGQGMYELRDAIASYLQKNKGIYASPENIIIGPGTEYLHHILIQLLGRNCFVAVEDPGYKKVGNIYESNGVKVLHIPVDGEGIVVDRLIGSNARLVHTSPSHHFPTGCVMPAARRHRLLAWAAEQVAFVIEDDYDSELRYDGRPVTSLFSMDSEHVIYMNTFTRSLASSIRVAYMILPDVLKEKYIEKLGFYSGTVSTFEQLTLASFINEGYYERHIRRMRSRYREYRSKLLEAIRETGLDKYVKVYEDLAGLHMIIEIVPQKKNGREIAAGANSEKINSEKINSEKINSEKINSEAFLSNLREKGINLPPLSQYCYRTMEKYDNRYLLCYGNIDKQILCRALTIIKEEITRGWV